jgi:23S rRNA (uracil1939-C5)-methyltransferase
MDYTAPGDLAEGRVSEVHKTWARAELREIRSPSAERVPPACPLYGVCGGCSLQHLAYAAQLEEKAAMLRDAFIRLGGFSRLPDIKTVPSAEYGYRNRVQFHSVQGAAPGGRLGFKARKSEKIIPLRDCPVADAGIRRALGEGLMPPGKRRFTVFARDGALLCEGRDGPGAVRILGRDLLMDPGLFFQGNCAMLERLIPELWAAAEKADRGLPMADIYCGVGTFAAFLQDLFEKIDLIEKNKAALDLARKNASGPLCRYFPLSDDAWAGLEKNREGGYGFAVADPPRQGLSPSLRQWFVREGPQILAYVSCDPATLARDSAALCGPYLLESVTLYDFYPQTAHIEALAIFSRGENYHA